MSKMLPTYESLPSHVRAWIDRNPYLAVKGEVWYWEGSKEACEKWIARQEEKWESYGIPFLLFKIKIWKRTNMGVKILSHMEVKIKKKNKKYFFIFSHSQNRTCGIIELILFFVSFL